MNVAKAAKFAGKAAMYTMFGVATPSMFRTAKLLKREATRRGEEIAMVKDLAKEAKAGITRAFAKTEPRDDSFEAMVQARPAGAASMEAVYFHFLSRKRACLTSMWVCVALGILGLLQGRWMGLAPILVGGGLAAWFAWLTEFRLWQLRGRKLSVAEGGSFSDFARAPGALRQALCLERGYGLDEASRSYRALLWAKRSAMVTAVCALLVTLDMYFSTLVRLSAIPACVAAVAILATLGIELRLRAAREAMGRPQPVLGAVRFEVGACLEGVRS